MKCKKCLSSSFLPPLVGFFAIREIFSNPTCFLDSFFQVRKFELCLKEVNGNTRIVKSDYTP